MGTESLRSRPPRSIQAHFSPGKEASSWIEKVMDKVGGRFLIKKGDLAKRISFDQLQSDQFKIAYKEKEECRFFHRWFKRFQPISIEVDGHAKEVYVNVNSLAKRLQLDKKEIHQKNAGELAGYVSEHLTKQIQNLDVIYALLSAEKNAALVKKFPSLLKSFLSLQLSDSQTAILQALMKTSSSPSLLDATAAIGKTDLLNSLLSKQDLMVEEPFKQALEVAATYRQKETFAQLLDRLTLRSDLADDRKDQVELANASPMTAHFFLLLAIEKGEDPKFALIAEEMIEAKGFFSSHPQEQEHGGELLSQALESNQEKIAVLLLQKGVQAKGRVKGSKSFLQLAVDQGFSTSTLKLLIEQEAKFQQRLPAQLAAEKGALKLAQWYLEEQAKNEEGQTPLYLALAHHLPLPLIQMLVEQGANIDAEVKGISCFDYALEHSSEEILHYLKDKKALNQPMTATVATATVEPMILEAEPAAAKEAKEIEIPAQIAPEAIVAIEEIDAESIPESVSESIAEPVSEPVSEPVAEPVFEPTAEPVAEPAVEIAEERDDVQLLLEQGLEAKNEEGQTPLLLALAKGADVAYRDKAVEVIEALIEKGADISASYNGLSCLHLALKAELTPIAAKLVEKGANIDEEAIHLAYQSQNVELVAVVLGLDAKDPKDLEAIAYKMAEQAALEQLGNEAGDEGVQIIYKKANPLENMIEKQAREEIAQLLMLTENDPVIALLLEKGINGQNEEGQTPLGLALLQFTAALMQSQHEPTAENLAKMQKYEMAARYLVLNSNLERQILQTIIDLKNSF